MILLSWYFSITRCCCISPSPEEEISFVPATCGCDNPPGVPSAWEVAIPGPISNGSCSNCNDYSGTHAIQLVTVEPGRCVHQDDNPPPCLTEFGTRTLLLQMGFGPTLDVLFGSGSQVRYEGSISGDCGRSEGYTMTKTSDQMTACGAFPSAIALSAAPP